MRAQRELRERVRGLQELDERLDGLDDLDERLTRLMEMIRRHPELMAEHEAELEDGYHGQAERDPREHPSWGLMMVGRLGRLRRRRRGIFDSHCVGCCI